ncbi:hypothetical protein KAM342_41880 [Aeromonas caviae]|uniref:hypothetical protein n=1 Tax=Aeromonas caviae TaxID=648 RepID=UPI001CC3B1A5|nr:hypothetical protein [Aeromonas caviae]GJA38945.1 hypothetical protein KAM342_41880 [Aeromonas caviae]GJA96498.1 hypothetical protein KAM358_43300 [Aeromonas caviae]
MRKILIILVLFFSSIGLWNYFALQKKLTDIVGSDYRNEGISVLLHFEWFVNPNVIVFDIREVVSIHQDGVDGISSAGMG